MIEYLYKEGEKACENEPLKVRLDGVHVGEIRKVETGFQYFPKGTKWGGGVHTSVALVQQSLRGDEE